MLLVCVSTNAWAGNDTEPTAADLNFESADSLLLTLGSDATADSTTLIQVIDHLQAALDDIREQQGKGGKAAGKLGKAVTLERQILTDCQMAVMMMRDESMLIRMLPIWMQYASVIEFAAKRAR